MTDRQQYAESDPRHPTLKIKGMLNEAAEHAREDVGKVDDPQAKALMETTTEVLLGLHKAYEDYEQRSERSWKR